MPPTGRLYLLFTPRLCVGDPWDTLAAALDNGVDLVQWRVEPSDRIDLDRCRETCRRAGVPLIVNNDVMLAIRIRAAGAHVGQGDMPIDAARRLLAGSWLGVSTSTPGQVRVAAVAGADYVGFGPCHPTATKGYDVGRPPEQIEAAVTEATEHRIPLFAIGGIRPDNLAPLLLRGVDRIAVSSCVLGSDQPGTVTASLRRML